MKRLQKSLPEQAIPSRSTAARGRPRQAKRGRPPSPKEPRDRQPAATEWEAGLYEASPAYLFTLSYAGIVVHANRAGAARLGLDPGRLCGRPFPSFVARGHRPVFAQFLKRVLANPEPQSCTLVLEWRGAPPACARLRGARTEDRQACHVVLEADQPRPAEDEAVEREPVSSSVLEDLTEVIARFQADGTLVYVNKVYCRFFGKNACQLIGTKWHPVAVTEDVPLIEQELQRLSPATPVVVIENRVYSGTGEVRWMQFVNRGIFDPSGRLVEIQAVGRDITERRQIEEKLRTSEERFRVALTAIPIPVFNQDRELRYTWIANPTLGMPAEACLGRTDEELLGPEMAAPLMAIKRRVLETGRGAREEVCLTRQGQTGWYDLMVEPHLDTQGRVTGVTCAALDMTERKRVESALRESETRFTTIFRASPQPIGLSRLRDGVFMEVNEAFARLHGYRREKIIGQTSEQLRLWHSGNRQEAMEALTRTQGSLTVEMQARCRNGRVRDLLASIQIVKVGGEDCVLGVLTDITERKAAAAELEASRQMLRTLASRLETVREEERQILARDIHDTFGHALTDWKFDLAWLGQQLGKAGFGARSAVRRRLDAMSQRVGVEMEAVHRIASALRPALLDTLGLLPAIESLARDFGRRAGLRCQVEGPATPLRLGGLAAVTLFRVTQELLTNVARHAQARAVQILLTVEPAWVVLRVEDDGRGIVQPAVSAPQSLGLLGIRERVTLLGGEVVIKGHRVGGGVTPAVPPHHRTYGSVSRRLECHVGVQA